MKLYRLEALLAALLGILMIAEKIRDFSGLFALLWLVLWGYLSFKCLMVAFSQKAYQEETQAVYAQRVRCRNAFGKFGYIAADIPLIALALGIILAVVCPDAPALWIILILLLVAVFGYAAWFKWYLSAHEQAQTDCGEGGPEKLPPEEELAWNRVERWHTACLGVLLALAILYQLF